nr:DUF2019 domain-containing protein [Arthrobacter sp. C9C5]
MWTNAYVVELEATDSIPLASDTRARRWNKHVHRMQRAQLELRKSPAGRAAITAMIAHPVPTVAQWSAAHSLFWAESEARTYLTALASSGGVGALEAKMVLREFDVGRLQMDSEPKHL